MPTIITRGAASAQGFGFGSGLGPADPYFNNVPLLLNGDGAANGSQNNTFLDSSTNNFTVTNTNSVLQGTPNPFGGSYYSNYFNGSTGALSVPNNAVLNPGTGNFTFECWVFLNSALSAQVEIYEAQANGIGVFIYANGILGLSQSFVAVLLTDTVAMPIGQWVHIAVVRSGTTISLFKNGTRVATAINSTNFVTSTINYIGRLSTGNYFPGYISNLRMVIGTAVYNPSLTTLTVPTTPLTAISGTQLLTCQSNRFVDNSTNNFAVTLYGTPTVSPFGAFLPTKPYSTTVNGGTGYFNGTSNYLSVPTSSALALGTGDFTIESWVYFNSVSATQQTLVGPWLYGSYGYVIQINSTSLTFAYGTSPTTGATYVPTNTFVSGTWYHIAVTRQSGSLKIFVNGTQIGTTQTITTNLTASTATAIGVNLDGTQQYVNGYISNLRIVKGTAVYTSNFTPSTSPLTAITNTALLLNNTNSGIPELSQNNVVQTVSTASVSTSVVKYGTGSLKFNGTSDYLSLPNNQALKLGSSNFTIEFWVYFNSVGANQAVLADVTTSSTGFSWIFYTSPAGTLGYYLSSNGTAWNIASAVSAGTVVTGQWYHVALVRNGSTFTPYLNGVSKTTTTSSATLFTNSSGISVGAINGLVNPFNGYIDDLRITNGIARYTANFTPPTAALPTY